MAIKEDNPVKLAALDTQVRRKTLQKHNMGNEFT